MIQLSPKKNDNNNHNKNEVGENHHEMEEIHDSDAMYGAGISNTNTGGQLQQQPQQQQQNDGMSPISTSGNSSHKNRQRKTNSMSKRHPSKTITAKHGVISEIPEKEDDFLITDDINRRHTLSHQSDSNFKPKKQNKRGQHSHRYSDSTFDRENDETSGSADSSEDGRGPLGQLNKMPKKSRSRHSSLVVCRVSCVICAVCTCVVHVCRVCVCMCKECYDTHTNRIRSKFFGKCKHVLLCFVDMPYNSSLGYV